MFFLLLGIAFAAEIPPVIPNVVCRETSDCLSFSKRLPVSPSTKLITAGYTCLNQQCVYVLSPGSECQQASQCSHYSFLDEILTKNKTNLLPPGVLLSDIPRLMENMCTASACSISSSCNTNYKVLFPEETARCCTGIEMGQKCEQRLDQLPVCKTGSICSPSDDISSSDLTCVENLPAKNTQWIGIVLSLIAAALTNLGLNLQKFALRKRHEKVVKRIEKERQSVFHQLTNLKASVTNFYKSNVSNPSISDHPEPTLTNAPAPGHTTPSSINTIRHVEPKTEKQDEGVTKDADQFQAKLDWKTLVKNPRWWLGFIIFAIGTFTNFAALQFAAQSLIGPLGSFSLVCNVVLAPLLNGEIWTWKDIVGVSLIVAGSVVVVIFSGHPIGDYDLCTLLKLFKTTGTIVFLTCSVSLLAAIFLYIVVVEKNLDIGDSRTEGIEEAIEEGELVDIVANPKPEGRFKQRKSKFGILVKDSTQDGNLMRVVTISAPKRSMDEIKVDDTKVVMRNKRRPSQTSNQDAIAQDPNAIRRRGSIPEYDDKRSSMLSVKSNFANMPLVDGEGNHIQIQDLFKGKDVDGASIHSVALTFKLPEQNPAPGLDTDAISLKSYKSAGKDQVIVMGANDNIPTSQDSWTGRLKSRLRRYKLVRDIMAIKLVPRFEKKISMESPYARIGLPFSYASLGGLTATLLTLFAKATINLLTSSFQGQNQFTSFSAFMFLGITVFCALSQIYWINLGLARYDALLQIPVFYVVWTLFDVIGGGIFYDEFAGFTTTKYVMFILGVAIIFGGVAVLAGRLKQLSDSDKEENVPLPAARTEV